MFPLALSCLVRQFQSLLSSSIFRPNWLIKELFLLFLTCSETGSVCCERLFCQKGLSFLCGFVSSWFSLAMTLAEQKDGLTDHRAPFSCVRGRHGGWWAQQQAWWNPACAFLTQVIFSVIDLFWTSAIAEEGGFRGKPKPVTYNEVLMNWKLAIDMPMAEMLTTTTSALQEKVSKMTPIRKLRKK